MTDRRLAIVEQRNGRWVATQLVRGDLADTLLELLVISTSPTEGLTDRCVDERCAYVGMVHSHDARGTWIER